MKTLGLISVLCVIVQIHAGGDQVSSSEAKSIMSRAPSGGGAGGFTRPSATPSVSMSPSPTPSPSPSPSKPKKYAPFCKAEKKINDPEGCENGCPKGYEKSFYMVDESGVDKEYCCCALPGC